MNTITLNLIPIPAVLDPEAIRAAEVFARKIFAAYTRRIPWVLDHSKPVSREDQACYAFRPARAK